MLILLLESYYFHYFFIVILRLTKFQAFPVKNTLYKKIILHVEDTPRNKHLFFCENSIHIVRGSLHLGGFFVQLTLVKKEKAFLRIFLIFLSHVYILEKWQSYINSVF